MLQPFIYRFLTDRLRVVVSKKRTALAMLEGMEMGRIDDVFVTDASSTVIKLFVWFTIKNG